MKNSRKTTKINFLDKMIFSFLSVGLVPYAPGTFGTIAAIPLAFYLKQYTSNLTIIILTTVLTIGLSFYVDRFQKDHDLHDPGWIVIDEVLGYLTAAVFITNLNIIHFIYVAILFRIFDIFKIWPASYFDKKVEHGAGIILDDIIAGLYAGLIYYLSTFFNFLP